MPSRADVSTSLGVISEKFDLKHSKIKRRVQAGKWSAATELVITDGRFTSLEQGRLKRAWDRLELKGSQPRHSQSGGRIKVMDLFSGCGGMALGVKQAIRSVGLDPSIALAADSDQDALNIYATNLSPTKIICENLWSLVDFQLVSKGNRIDFLKEPLMLHRDLRNAVGEIDIVIGGPPCEGHSNFNNSTRRNDPRNLLYLVPLAIGTAVGASAIIIENVPEVTRDQLAQVTLLAKQIAECRGYKIEDKIINCLSIGVAQTRRRHILLASRKGSPQIAAALDALRTEKRDVKFAIGDLLRREGTTQFDTPSVLSPENKKRIDHLFRHGLFDMPNRIRPNCHKKGTSYVSVYGRLSWGEPSGTITTGFMSPGRGRYIHPERRRALTPHEAARIQGFPDHFRFELPNVVISKKLLSKLIGDAVPPQLGYLAGLATLAAQ